LDGLDIIATATGRKIVQLRNGEEENPVNCCFSPDGNAAAVQCLRGSTTAVRIIDLPSGREVRRFDLPIRMWQPMNEWVGDRLYAGIEVPTGPKGYLRQTYSFDLTAESIGDGRPEPLLGSTVDGQKFHTYWCRGPGWVAHWSSGRETWEEWIERVSTRIGIKFRAGHGQDNVLRFLNADSGRLRYEFPTPVKFPCAISGDGRRLAWVGFFGVVEVWDVDPPARWPWALITGTVGAGSILIFGRWRSRRLRQNPQAVSVQRSFVSITDEAPRLIHEVRYNSES
jgi:hypothetical protein